MVLMLLPYVAAVQQLTKHLVCQLLLCTTEVWHTLPAISCRTAKIALARHLAAVWPTIGQSPFRAPAMHVCVMVQSA